MKPHENGMIEHKSSNNLIEATSPYLLQHAHNPVNWYPWGEEALQLAVQQNKPIFLSIGYSACHWCHVMERESFENIEIARVLNEHFISIKVDREERPDIDEIYMQAVQLMTGSGGWPLSVWLTPDLQPFFGGTYFPPEDRWGRAGFKKILGSIAQLWHDQQGQVFQKANQLTAYLEQLTEVESMDADFGLPLWKSAFRKAEENFDERYGGFGSAPKFPQAMELSFLLRYYFHTGEKRALEMVEKSLQGMANGGLYDHLGGGFHRYSTDERWLVPHFEKMLYDNALLIITYLEAYQIIGKPFYADIARATLDYMVREMTDPGGGFYSSQDADSEGEEGKYYVWQKQEIDKILGQDESKLFCDVYGASQEGNWEGKNILNLRRSLQGIAEQYNTSLQELAIRLEEARQKLFETRLKRISPDKDDKILSAWNGLMISAMCKGFQVLGEKKYLLAAEKAIAFVLEKMYIKDRILRTYRTGKSQINGYLSDYALLSAALIDLYESTFDLSFLEKAIEINQLMLQKFYDEKQAGFFFTASDHKHLLIRTRNPYDNAIPSGNSVAVSNLLRLSEFTGDSSLKQKAEQTIKLYTAQIQRSPSGFAFLLSSTDYFWSKPKEIVVAGDRNSDLVTDMFAAIHSRYLPNKVIAYADPALSKREVESSKILPLIEGKISSNGEAKIFVCENYTCQNPFTTIDQYKAYHSSLLPKGN